MSSVLDPNNRLGYAGDLRTIIEHVGSFFNISVPNQTQHLAEGYEDCNLKLQTHRGRYVCKLFADNQLGDYSKSRRGEDVADRLVEILLAVQSKGGSVPELIKGKTGYLFREDGLVAICYKWIDGTSYYDLGRAPTSEELVHIVEQAARINTTNLKPVYYHDIWAVPHIRALATKVRDHLPPQDAALIEQVLERFETVRIDELPKCLVHGDFTKGNVILGENGKPHIIDFSVTNWTTRIIELVLIISNLMYDKTDKRTLGEKAEEVVEMYQRYNPLTKREIEVLPSLALAGSAMEFLGGVWRQNFLSDDSEETNYWLNLGRETLERELRRER